MNVSEITEKDLVKIIDQTNLQPDLSEEGIKKFIEETKRYNFYGIAVMPIWVPLATKMLEGSDMKIIAAIGFPLGAIPLELKVEETRWVIENGPSSSDKLEIDFVINITQLKSGNYAAVRDEISEIVKTAEGRIVKVIIEVPLLTREEIVIVSLLAEAAGAHFVKTATGFRGWGFPGPSLWRPTTAEDVALIKNVIGDKLKIKASGGIETLSDVLAVLEAGADRIGTAYGVQIINEYRKLKQQK
jgi:deoxyribose-phosphate aldolase